MKQKTWRKLMTLTAGVTAAAMLTACGGGKTTGSETGGTQPAAAQTNGAVSQTEAETIGIAKAEANTRKTDETLTVMLNAEPNGIFSGDNNEGGLIILNAVADSILEFDSVEKTWRPGICEGYEKVDDTHYTFKVRDDAVYSDGTPVTAEDCVYSLGMWKDSGASQAQYYDMEQTAVIDDKHFTLALTEYVPKWEFFVAQHPGVVVSEAAVEAAGGIEGIKRTQPVTAGRYRITEWQPGSYIMTERNDTYYDKDYTGYYKYIKYVFVADSSSRILAVKSGDADIAYRVSAADVASSKNDDTIQDLVINTSCYNVYFNNESGPCADVKVREALSCAIDGNAVNASVMMGMGQLTRGLILPQFPYYKEKEPVALDYEKAKALLAEAGYGDGLELSLPVIATTSQVATVIQESLRQIGVTVNIEVLEQQAFAERARGGQFDFIVGTAGLCYENTNNFNQFDPDLKGRSVQNCRVTEGADELSGYIDMCYSSDEATVAEGWGLVQDFIFDNYCLTGTCTTHLYSMMRTGLEGYTAANTMDHADVTEVHPVQ